MTSEIRQRRGRPEERYQKPRFGAVSSSILPGGKGRDAYEDNNEDFVTPMERAAFRERKTAAWARTMPLRIQQFLQQSGSDVAMRIFKEVVIRFPVHHSSKEEVMALLEPYGQVEYVSGPKSIVQQYFGSKDKGEKGGGESGAANTRSKESASVGMEAEASFCHLVRFEEGADAVRCFFSLNGALIDPEQHKMLIESIKEAYRQMQLEEGVDPESIVDDLPDELQVPLMAPADSTRHIFITVDFFRLAFVMPDSIPVDAKPGRSPASKGPSGMPRSASRTSIPARSSLISMVPHRKSSGPAVNQLHQQLRMMALKMDDVFSLLSSRGVEWEEFCFLVNFFSFLNVQSIPTYRGEEFALATSSSTTTSTSSSATSSGEQMYKDFEEYPQLEEDVKNRHISPEEQIPTLSVAGSVRTVYRAMKHARWDCTRILGWIDHCSAEQGEKRLIEGRAARVETSGRGLSKVFIHGPHAQVFQLLALLVGLTIILILILRFLVV